ncbi:MAG TPA: right-handed parallel beta-helix repeat-containing protein [Bradyrhizobium sp.]|jgi:hypothetical protein|nr:right-handed parallel beta-helix repeat-containing protein [Bradyrhizobium sp.]
MRNYKSYGAAIAVASALFAISAPAHAQATRTWVAGTGSDANPCSRTAPCKTFTWALANTAVNGLINCIDSGAYGVVNITKSVTIDCHDVFASILAGQDGITGVIINIPVDPKDPLRTVRLRNIDISGVSIGSAGISIVSAAAVILEDLAVTGMVKNGIVDSRTDGNTMLAVKNTIVANNAGVGISAGATAPNNIVLDNVHSIKNVYGVAVAKNNSVVINRSVFSNNSTAGVEADSGAQMMMDSSVVSYNATGIIANGGPVAIANTDVTLNGTGISGVITSFGNNRIFGNAAAGTAPTPAGASSPALGQQ